MTKHLTAQPPHCLQCLRLFPVGKLNHGRCGTCRSRTPASAWNAHHDPRQREQGVQLNAFVDGNAHPAPLVSRLLPVEEAARILDEVEDLIARAQIKRVERISQRCTLERYQDLETGEQLQRVTLRVAEGDQA